MALASRILTRTRQLYVGRAILPHGHEHSLPVRSFAKDAAPPARSLIKGDEMLKNIFYDVKNKFDIEHGVLRKEKITIDSDDSAALSHSADVIKTVREKLGMRIGNNHLVIGQSRQGHRKEQMRYQHFSPQEKITAENDIADAGSFRSMNFVRGALEEDEQNSRKKKDFVHVLMIKNQTFVTVTDAKGNKKMGASAGSLEERKGRSRLSRYAAEATSEHVGRSARKMGLKSVVMKVKGCTYFRKKHKVLLSFREGFRGEGGNQSPITVIHDVTQLPHNGCRLPKRRRV